MRIRYAYRLDMENGESTFVVLNHIKSEEEVRLQFAEKGCTKATFHNRVRTGFRLDSNGELVETGLVGTRTQAAPAAADEPKKSKKAAKKKSK